MSLLDRKIKAVLDKSVFKESQFGIAPEPEQVKNQRYNILRAPDGDTFNLDEVGNLRLQPQGPADVTDYRATIDTFEDLSQKDDTWWDKEANQNRVRKQREYLATLLQTDTENISNEMITNAAKYAQAEAVKFLGDKPLLDTANQRDDYGRLLGDLRNQDNESLAEHFQNPIFNTAMFSKHNEDAVDSSLDPKNPLARGFFERVGDEFLALGDLITPKGTLDEYGSNRRKFEIAVAPKDVAVKDTSTFVGDGANLLLKALNITTEAVGAGMALPSQVASNAIKEQLTPETLSALLNKKSVAQETEAVTRAIQHDKVMRSKDPRITGIDNVFADFKNTLLLSGQKDKENIANRALEHRLIQNIEGNVNPNATEDMYEDPFAVTRDSETERQLVRKLEQFEDVQDIFKKGTETFISVTKANENSTFKFKSDFGRGIKEAGREWKDGNYLTAIGKSVETLVSNTLDKPDEAVKIVVGELLPTTIMLGRTGGLGVGALAIKLHEDSKDAYIEEYGKAPDELTRFKMGAVNTVNAGLDALVDRFTLSGGKALREAFKKTISMEGNIPTKLLLGTLKPLAVLGGRGASEYSQEFVQGFAEDLAAVGVDFNEFKANPEKYLEGGALGLLGGTTSGPILTANELAKPLAKAGIRGIKNIPSTASMVTEKAGEMLSTAGSQVVAGARGIADLNKERKLSIEDRLKPEYYSEKPQEALLSLNQKYSGKNADQYTKEELQDRIDTGKAILDAFAAKVESTGQDADVLEKAQTDFITEIKRINSIRAAKKAKTIVQSTGTTEPDILGNDPEATINDLTSSIGSNPTDTKNIETALNKIRTNTNLSEEAKAKIDNHLNLIGLARKDQSTVEKEIREGGGNQLSIKEYISKAIDAITLKDEKKIDGLLKQATNWTVAQVNKIKRNQEAFDAARKLVSEIGNTPIKDSTSEDLQKIQDKAKELNSNYTVQLDKNGYATLVFPLDSTNKKGEAITNFISLVDARYNGKAFNKRMGDYESTLTELDTLVRTVATKADRDPNEYISPEGSQKLVGASSTPNQGQGTGKPPATPSTPSQSDSEANAFSEFSNTNEDLEGYEREESEAFVLDDVESTSEGSGKLEDTFNEGIETPQWNTSRKESPVFTEDGKVDVLRKTKTNEHFGNPFVSQRSKGEGTIDEVSKRFANWIKGISDQNVEPERRKWIIEQIKSGKLDNKIFIYYTSKAQQQAIKAEGATTNHAIELKKLVNDKSWIKDEKPAEEAQIEENGSPNGEGQAESITQGEQEGNIPGVETDVKSEVESTGQLTIPVSGLQQKQEKAKKPKAKLKINPTDKLRTVIAKLGGIDIADLGDDVTNVDLRLRAENSLLQVFKGPNSKIKNTLEGLLRKLKDENWLSEDATRNDLINLINNNLEDQHQLTEDQALAEEEYRYGGQEDIGIVEQLELDLQPQVDNLPSVLDVEIGDTRFKSKEENEIRKVYELFLKQIEPIDQELIDLTNLAVQIAEGKCQ